MVDFFVLLQSTVSKHVCYTAPPPSRAPGFQGFIYDPAIGETYEKSYTMVHTSSPVLQGVFVRSVKEMELL